DDGVLMPPGQPLVKGHQAIERYYRGMFQTPVRITSFTFSNMVTMTAGDLGYAIGLYQQRLSGAPAGPIEDSGKFVVVLKRTNSSWRSAYTIYNSDHPPANCGAAALPLPSPLRDFALLIGHYAATAHGWLIALAWFGSAVLVAASIVLLIHRAIVV